MTLEFLMIRVIIKNSSVTNNFLYSLQLGLALPLFYVLCSKLKIAPTTFIWNCICCNREKWSQWKNVFVNTNVFYEIRKNMEKRNWFPIIGAQVGNFDLCNSSVWEVLWPVFHILIQIYASMPPFKQNITVMGLWGCWWGHGFYHVLLFSVP